MHFFFSVKRRRISVIRADVFQVAFKYALWLAFLVDQNYWKGIEDYMGGARGRKRETRASYDVWRANSTLTIAPSIHYPQRGENA